MSRYAADLELGEVLDFLRLLWEIEHLLRSTSKYMQSRLGITGPQRLVLRIVERFPGITAGEISSIIHLHPATLTGIIDRLASRRLLTRVRDARDGRRVRLVPSAPASAEPPSVSIESAVAAAFSEVRSLDIKHARRVLEAVASKLERHAQEQASVSTRRGILRHEPAPRSPTRGRRRRSPRR